MYVNLSYSDRIQFVYRIYLNCLLILPIQTKYRSHKPYEDKYHKKVIGKPVTIRRSTKTYVFDAETRSRKIANVTEHFECVNCCLEFDGQTSFQNHMLRKHSTSLVIVNTICYSTAELLKFPRLCEK